MRADGYAARTLGASVGVGVGVVVGLALIAATLAVSALGPDLGRPVATPGLGRPAAPFLPWAAITLLVAVAEEALLRGLLFDRIVAAARARGAQAGGRGEIVVAVVLTSAVFAAMHVPVYGWHVVPLDLGVGCCLGGLRILTEGSPVLQPRMPSPTSRPGGSKVTKATPVPSSRLSPPMLL